MIWLIQAATSSPGTSLGSWLGLAVTVVAQLAGIVVFATMLGRKDGQREAAVKAMEERFTTAIATLGATFEASLKANSTRFEQMLTTITAAVEGKQSKEELRLIMENQNLKYEAMERLQAERLGNLQAGVAGLEKIFTSSHHRLRNDMMVVLSGGRLRQAPPDDTKVPPE